MVRTAEARSPHSGGKWCGQCGLGAFVEAQGNQALCGEGNSAGFLNACSKRS